MKRSRVHHAALLAFAHVETRRLQPIADEVQRRSPVVALDGKDGFERGLKTFVDTLQRLNVRLKQFPVRSLLDLQQVWDLF